jgi:hypothetical protein
LIICYEKGSDELACPCAAATCTGNRVSLTNIRMTRDDSYS